MPALKKDEDATSQKVSGQKDISFLQRLRLIKRKWLFIGGGVLLLLLVGIMANLSSSTSSDNFLPSEPQEGEASISGTVSDEEGNPVDGARVISRDHIVTTGPDGNFVIPAETGESLTVSAFGYESSTVSSSNPEARLAVLSGGTVRISVIDKDRNPLEDSLVVRLDPNTSAPVSEAITDQYGSVFFAEIPSGQAAFIVLRPGYGIGWAELAVAPGSTEQQVIVLPEMSVGKELSSSSDWWPIKPIYAQEREYTITPPVENGLSWSVDKDSDTSAYIQVIRDNEQLQILIHSLNQAASGQKGVPFDPVLVRDLLAQKGLDIPVSTVRILRDDGQGARRITYQNGMEPSTVPADSISIPISQRPANASMAFLQRQYRQNLTQALSDPDTVVATSWSEAEAAELSGAHDVLLDSPHRSVCCHRPDVEGSTSGSAEDIPSSVSSNTAEPSDIQIKTAAGESRYTPSYDASIATGELVSAAEEARKNARDYSLAKEIPAPDPAYAPPEFLHDFLEAGSNPSVMYGRGSTHYQYFWENYLLYKTQYASDRAQSIDGLRDSIEQGIADQRIRHTAAQAAAQAFSAAAGMTGGIPGAAGAAGAGMTNNGSQSSDAGDQVDNDYEMIITPPDDNSDGEDGDGDYDTTTPDTNTNGSAGGSTQSNPQGGGYGPGGTTSR